MEQDEQERFGEDGEPLESAGVVAVAAGVVPGVAGGVQRGVLDRLAARRVDRSPGLRSRLAAGADILMLPAGVPFWRWVAGASVGRSAAVRACVL